MLNLERYVEAMCWKMYRKARVKDNALSMDDFRQQAQLALLHAGNAHDPSREASWTTYAVTCVRNSLRSMMGKGDNHCERSAEEYYPDFFLFEVEQLFKQVPLTARTRRLLSAALNAHKLSRCSYETLRKSLDMTDREFRLSCAELRKKFA